VAAITTVAMLIAFVTVATTAAFATAVSTVLGGTRAWKPQQSHCTDRYRQPDLTHNAPLDGKRKTAHDTARLVAGEKWKSAPQPEVGAMYAGINGSPDGTTFSRRRYSLGIPTRVASARTVRAKPAALLP